MSLLQTLRAAFKGGAQARVPLGRGFASPWSWTYEPGGTRLPFEYRSAVRHGYLGNPVAQRAVRLVAEGVGAAPLAQTDETALALFAAPSEGMRLFDSSTGQVVLYRGGWQRPVTPAEPSGGTTIDAEARTAISGLIAALVEAGVFPTP